ncbi:MAG: hypothetical protein VB106_12465 [Clostridiaceae bacterium]|jgi:predicted transcriptional regulator|nr:hypothetical protein [Clostridiaceae bacterium]
MLLSINPEHVENILNGNKKYEFRKVRCRADVDKMIIYSTAPVMAVVGEAEIINIIEDEPEKVWALTADYSGINKDSFNEYYRERDKAVAYKLGEIKKYIEPLKLSDFGISYAPQSFVYIK